ncbi:Protein hunchback [Frankliniella fusca]|uniref:Protein hunchback n=1 Tax=Frankliniella fusca TaxID=407009 RepID=A0AAE1H8B4_9NEOP|nr:Protein hunchback [Frankliniella fusca]
MDPVPANLSESGPAGPGPSSSVEVSGADGTSSALEVGLCCSQCKCVVPGGMAEFKCHLAKDFHSSPFRCGHCSPSYTHRRTLYGHLRDHHKAVLESSSAAPPLYSVETLPEAYVLHELVFDEPRFNPSETICHEEVNSGPSLQSAAERSVLKLRSVTYMTTVAMQAANDQCYGLMQDTASYLKDQVLNYLAMPDSERNLEVLLQEFSIDNPFEKLMTKQQQLQCFQEKYGLIPPQEVYLGEAFDSRQHAKRPRLVPTQIQKSYQYVSIIDILSGVMKDPHLRNLILSEKSSSDGFLRSFRDGALFETMPPDLQAAIRINIYVDDLEVLQALSSRAGAYKVAALAFADDAKRQEVWERFLLDMQELETNGLDVEIDGKITNFKAVLRPEMWAHGTKIGPLRTPDMHKEDVRGCNNAVIRKATGVRGPPLLHGLRFFNCVTSSVPDIFHDMNQGICKMKVKLALREFVCFKKYLTDEELNSWSYNLHQTGAQMWCLVRVFPFLLSDVVPAEDKFFKLICLLNEIMAILFAHAVSEYDLETMDKLIHEHHMLFKEIFPGTPLRTSMAAQHEEMQAQVEPENSFENPDDPEVIHTKEGSEEMEHPEEEFSDEESVPHDDEVEVLHQPETLMEILQMKIVADRLKPSRRSTMGKRGRQLIYMSEAPHRKMLVVFGLQPEKKIYSVNHVLLNGVDLRPELFVTEKLKTASTLPVFSCIRAVYVSSCEEDVYLVLQEVCTVRYNARLCAYLITSSRKSPLTVKNAKMFPSYRLLSTWTPYGGSELQEF